MHKGFAGVMCGRGRKVVAAAMATAAMTAGAPGATAATVGQAGTAATGFCTDGVSYVQTGVASGNPYSVPVAGALTSFATRAFDPSTTAGNVRLVVERPVSGNTYLVVSQSTAFTVPASEPAAPISHAITGITVHAGDVIGFATSGSSRGTVWCATHTADAADTYGGVFGPLTPGTNVLLTPYSGFRPSLTANLRVLTNLTAAPVTSPSYVLSATLRDYSGAGISGQTVSFATSAGPVCSATTSASGVASCAVSPYDKASVGAINIGGYTAEFAGTPNGFFPSSSHGTWGTAGSPSPAK